MRFGLIGTGLMAQEHIRNLRLVDGCEVVALVDPRQDSIDWAQGSLGYRAAGFADVGAMLSQVRPDAVIVW